MQFRMFIIGILSFFTLTVNAQSDICLGNDTIVCQGESLVLESCSGLQIPGGLGSVLTNPTSVNLSDDRWSNQIPIGFNFDFYGNTYNQVVIGSNGLISFDLSHASTHNAYSFAGLTSLPDAGFDDAHNAVMVAYSDINPNSGGQILYETIGTAPNRSFYVVYVNIPMFNATDCNYMSIILHETSNTIEMHISNKTVNAGWNGGKAIQGIQNNDGSIAHITPGRNVTQWTAVNDGKLFTPVSPTNTSDYRISDVPYHLIVSGSATFEWENTNGQTFPYNNGFININNIQQGTTGYFLTVSGANCNSQVGAVSDTTFITGLTSSVAATATDDMCSAGIGSVTATATSGDAPYTFNWPGLGNATTATVNNVSSGTYTVEMTDDNGCMSTTTVTVGDTPANYPSSTTQVSCPGGSDGTATVVMDPPIGNVTYQWNDPMNQTTSTATGLQAGTYECLVTSDVGCSNTVTVTVTEVPGMDIQVINQNDVTCNSANDGIVEVNVTDGNPPYSYSWTGSASTTSLADDLYVGTTTVTITDDEGCVTSEDITLGEPDPLSFSALSQDTVICIGDSVMLFANASGGSSAYNFNWESNGNVVGNSDTIYVTPTTAFTEYCVTLTEACGSPSVTQCVNVEYPGEVDPMISPDTTGACFPVEVNFDNITNTTETIDYTVWKYSDGDTDTIGSLNSTTHTFYKGLYDVDVKLVSDRGCEYEKSYPDLIEGYPYPKPSFYINPNPVTLYEPFVDVFSQSSNDIVSYKWYAEGAKPDFSTLKDPSFEYPEEIKNHPLLLVVENSFGCVDSLTRLVRVENEVTLFAPNTFTPDANGQNDKWKVTILGVDVYNFKLEVFNRWGEKVFESHDPEGAWDGSYNNKIAPEGTYVWKIRALDFDTDQVYMFNGYVNLLK
ncbi:PKD domain-containing protein [Brumimicrobium salinarum]|uniref:PKD domain-containing protein n=1 Tax=Brumimicrobium salinarum TaxID=2058658 RepID=A0A2I0R069_9FLAO|nr:gliding motility-associated C-terminal domain-containing protein [Brumimicrobium salinarum]PKR79992.1 PKD domain-containing protein [Brumimicrobium salinarum]